MPTGNGEPEKKQDRETHAAGHLYVIVALLVGCGARAVRRARGVEGALEGRDVGAIVAEVLIRPVPQRPSKRDLRAGRPDIVARLAGQVKNLVLRALDPVVPLGLRPRRDGLEVLHDLGAVEVQGQVVDVVAERVLNLAADEQDREDDDRRCD